MCYSEYFYLVVLYFYNLNWIDLFLSNYYCRRGRLTKNYYDLSNLEFRSTSKARYTLLQHRLYRLYLPPREYFENKNPRSPTCAPGWSISQSHDVKIQERGNPVSDFCPRLIFISLFCSIVIGSRLIYETSSFPDFYFEYFIP